MLRRGRSFLPTPSGWHDAFRGPRPQPAQWPRRQQRHSSKQRHCSWPAVLESWGTPTRRRWHRGSAPRLNPDEAKAAARTRVEVGDRTGHIGRDRLRGSSGVAVGHEGCETRCTRTPTGGSNGGVSGMHQTVIGQVGSIGTGARQRTERGGRRIGSHREVPRRDVPGSSRPRCRNRAVEVACRGDGDRAGRGSEETF